jgi:hypothetical protein
MLRRLLNIASIVCLVLCVALMGMWVRSYYSMDSFGWSNERSWAMTLTSLHGRARFLKMNLPPGLHLGYTRMFVRLPASGVTFDAENNPGYSKTALPRVAEWSGFYWSLRSTDANVAVPYWFLVLTTGSLAMLLRTRWPLQFTLRSLFIVTTFLAVVLGMIGWLDHWRQ